MTGLSIIFLGSVIVAFLFIGWIKLCVEYVEGNLSWILAVGVPVFCIYVFIIVVENWEYLTL